MRRQIEVNFLEFPHYFLLNAKLSSIFVDVKLNDIDL